MNYDSDSLKNFPKCKKLSLLYWSDKVREYICGQCVIKYKNEKVKA